MYFYFHFLISRFFLKILKKGGNSAYVIYFVKIKYLYVDLGIDVNFLENMDEEIRVSEERHEMQQRLDSMCQLLEKLQQTQMQRLSAPLPPNLNNVMPPSEEENQMADAITDNLSDMAKRVNPGEIAPVPGESI